MNWIDIDREVPKYDKDVLLLCQNFITAIEHQENDYGEPYVRVGYRQATTSRGEGFHVYGKTNDYYNDTGLDIVTHWIHLQHLPKPPNTEKK